MKQRALLLRKKAVHLSKSRNECWDCLQCLWLAVVFEPRDLFIKGMSVGGKTISNTAKIPAIEDSSVGFEF